MLEREEASWVLPSEGVNVVHELLLSLLRRSVPFSLPYLVLAATLHVCSWLLTLLCTRTTVEQMLGARF